MIRMLAALILGLAAIAGVTRSDEPLRVGVFAVDASPPIGSPMAYDPTKEIVLPLSCRGVVLIGQGEPIVLCAVDWIGIANDGHLEFRRALAEAAGTTLSRVNVHALHQHDAPHCDFSADRLMAEYGINREFFDTDFARRMMKRAASAVSVAKSEAKPVTHLGLGEAEVEKVASNRRILGPDGKVEFVRFTACADPKIRDKPVGTIDPKLKMISFWNGDSPIVALTYYATHPQSYYRTGGANPDFPGIARDQREQATRVPHIHFNGAGGNIGAGKWNDGSHENRQILANRVASGMARALDATKREPITASDLDWDSVLVELPVSPHLDEKRLLASLESRSAPLRERADAASSLAWLRRCRARDQVEIGCLRLNRARILHMPGELFVEYQLSAQRMRPDLFVAMAAYGDYGPGYIGTEIAYHQGGYETGPNVSLVAPNVENVLMDAMKRLMRD